MQPLAFAFTPRHHASSAVLTVPQGSQQPALLLCSTQGAHGYEPSYNGLWTRPLSLLFPGRESSGLRNDFKSLPFLKVITLLLYDLLFLWLPCVIYEHLETLAHKKDNIVEAEMQLIMWCCKEAARGWRELLHQGRQLLRSEMQGRKDKSLEEMEKNQEEMWVNFVPLGQWKHLAVHQVYTWPWASNSSTLHPALQEPIGSLGFWSSSIMTGPPVFEQTLSIVVKDKWMKIVQ